MRFSEELEQSQDCNPSLFDLIHSY